MKRIFAVLAMAAMVAGCAVKQPGNRTFNFGPDGATVTSETTEMPADAMVEQEKEKTRQVCYKQQASKKAKIEQLADTQPLVFALIAQTDAINNAVSLAITRKPYDPCPSSTNSSDVEIADAAMYTSIYKDGFSLLKTLGLGWIAGEAVESVVGAIAKGTGYSFATAGDGSPINITESMSPTTFRDGATVADMLNRPIDNSVHTVLPAPVPETTSTP